VGKLESWYERLCGSSILRKSIITAVAPFLLGLLIGSLSGRFSFFVAIPLISYILCAAYAYGNSQKG